MSFFTRFYNGWEIAKTSFKVLNANKELVIFPILSGISMLLVIGSFFGVLLARVGWNIDNVGDIGVGMRYLILFGFYIVSYFIVVFFNMGLMHCAKLYFDGEEVSVAKGLKFSVSRIGAIFSWVVFAATIGVILRALQDNLGWVGKILIGIVGIVWSVATFFVIPVIAYENVGPYEALQRSAKLVKEKWGEGIGANFSIGLVTMGGFLIIAVIGMVISAMVNEQAGIWIFVFGAFAMIIVTSALHSIFISAIYNHINGNLNDHFNKQTLDSLFVEK